MKRDIRSVALVVKRQSLPALNLAQSLAEWLRSRQVETLAEPDEAQGLAAVAMGKQELVRRADLIVALGGDGTLLSIARFIGERETPILGINLGGLGFLTQATTEEAQATIERVLAGDFEIDRRITLDARISGPSLRPIEGPLKALNDVVITKRKLGRLLEMEVLADGHHFCSYRADGLIVATPTGSTGYALSAGGPIVFPTLNVMVLAPICPHTLSNRPVVLPDSAEIEIRARSNDHDGLLSMDGQEAAELGPGTSVIVNKSDTCVALVKCPHSYYEIWRNKLRWG